ncbi:vacuolar ATPase assembly integral membrane protein vma21-like [Lineus longissimus]|uniref:vacuolar ATPase assembly integral membrane protein vma21-like n=1 Tax=Lineus longissimus TaxID=88925 RepID=UPI002B4F9E67
MADLQRTQMSHHDGSLGHVTKTLVTFSLMIIILPLFLYFFTKSFVFEAVFLMSSRQSYFYAAIVAVVTVQVMLGIFIYVAYQEGTEVYDKNYKED